MSHDSFFTARAPVWINDNEGVVRTVPAFSISGEHVGATRDALIMSMAALASTSATNWDHISVPARKERIEFTDEEKAEIAELSGKEKKRRVAEIKAKYKAADET